MNENEINNVIKNGSTKSTIVGLVFCIHLENVRIYSWV